MRIYDVTVPLDHGVPIFPGDPEFRLNRVAALSQGGVCNISKVDCGVHTGTHVDAPVHFIDGAAGVEALPLDAMVGEVFVVDATDIRGNIDAAALDSLRVPSDVERLIFKTRNSRFWSSARFEPEFVGVTEDGASALVERGVRLVGIDYLSIAPPGQPTPTHLVLLGAAVVIVEGLDLRDVPPDRYQLTCLPIRLIGADGAPARVLLQSTG